MTENNPSNPLDPQQPVQPPSFDLPPQAAPYQAPGSAYTPPPPAYPAPGSAAPYAAPGAGAYQQPVYNANQPTPPGMYEAGAPGAPNYGVAPGGMYPPVPTMGGIGQPATAGVRFLGGLIDLIIISVVSGILGSLASSSAIQGVVEFALIVGYCAYFNGQGQTLGKMVMKTKVVDVATGAPIGMQRAAIRGVLQAVFAFVACLPYLSIFMTPDLRGWHDQVANDKVIKIG
jgi:uncharacterized RDD family membrane protein YckC